MKLDHYFFHVKQIWHAFITFLSKSSEDQKKQEKVFTETCRVFSPKSRQDQKKKESSSPKLVECLSPKSREDHKQKTTKKSAKIIQRSNADHSQIIGGDAVKLLGGYIPSGVARGGRPALRVIIFGWHHFVIPIKQKR